LVAEKISLGMGMPEGGPISEQLQNALLRDSEKLLNSAIRPYRDHINIDTGVLVGTPFLEVIREVLRSKHDLAVPGLAAWVRDSCALAVSGECG
jgi:hypothetical protein